MKSKPKPKPEPELKLKQQPLAEKRKKWKCKAYASLGPHCSIGKCVATAAKKKKRSDEKELERGKKE